MTRVFDAPRRLVYDALTKPELVQRWLGVFGGRTMSVCEIDLKVGGKYRYVWSSTERPDMGMGGSSRRSCRRSASSARRSSTSRGTRARRWTRVFTSRAARRRSRPPCCTSRRKRATPCSSRRWTRASARATTRSTGCWRRCRVSPARTPRPHGKDGPRLAGARRDPAHGRGDGPLRPPLRPRVRRARGDDAGAGEADGQGPRAGGGAVGERVVRGAHDGRARGRPGARHPRGRWTRGPPTSTTGGSATPPASTCSTGRRSRGRRRAAGRSRRASSSSAAALP